MPRSQQSCSTYQQLITQVLCILIEIERHNRGSYMVSSSTVESVDSNMHEEYVANNWLSILLLCLLLGSLLWLDWAESCRTCGRHAASCVLQREGSLMALSASLFRFEGQVCRSCSCCFLQSQWLELATGPWTDQIQLLQSI